MDQFSPIETIERSLRFWWVVALLVICGGMAGWIFHLVQPPLYDAKVEFTAAVDFNKAGPIDTLEQDKSIAVVGDTIHSYTVIDQVVVDAQAAGIKVDQASLLEMAYVERKSEIWELRIRNANPQVAQTLANLWADQAFADLITYHQHAQQADALTTQLAVLSMCMQQAYLPGSQDTLCKDANQADLASQYKQVSDALQAEQMVSGGLPSWVTFDLKQKADLPTRPVTYGTNSLVLAGSLIGFILGVWMVAGRLPEHLSRLFVRRHVQSHSDVESQRSRSAEATGRNQ